MSAVGTSFRPPTQLSQCSANSENLFQSVPIRKESSPKCGQTTDAHVPLRHNGRHIALATQRSEAAASCAQEERHPEGERASQVAVTRRMSLHDPTQVTLSSLALLLRALPMDLLVSLSSPQSQSRNDEHKR